MYEYLNQNSLKPHRFKIKKSPFYVRKLKNRLQRIYTENYSLQNKKKYLGVFGILILIAYLSPMKLDKTFLLDFLNSPTKS